MIRRESERDRAVETLRRIGEGARRAFETTARDLRAAKLLLASSDACLAESVEELAAVAKVFGYLAETMLAAAGVFALNEWPRCACGVRSLPGVRRCLLCGCDRGAA